MVGALGPCAFGRGAPTWKESDMNTKFLLNVWSLAAALSATPMLSMAEAPPRGITPVANIPEMIPQAAMTVLPSRTAPYRLQKDVEPLNIFREAPKSLEQIPNACSKASGALCYDYRTGHAVYKPMRTLLPPISGMTPHNLSLRRDKIVAQYTFK